MTRCVEIRIVVLIVMVIAFIGGGTDRNSSGESVMREYYIMNERVPEHEFRSFMESLTEVPGTWYCEEHEGGGETGYQAEDVNGQVFDYISESGEAGQVNRVARIP